jgi:sec-independent protein translocase protein TatA
MFNGSIGPWELLLVLAIVLVIFGPKRLPGLGRQLGRGMREFKESITGGDRGGDDDEEDVDVDADADADQRPAVTAATTTDTRPEESQAAASEALGREPSRGGPGAA